MKKVFLLIAAVLTLNADKFLIMTEDLKPYNYLEEGKIKGISVEVVQKVLKNLEYEKESIWLYPWSRALQLLDSRKNGVLFSMSYTPQRAQKYKFACPLSEVELYFYLKQNSPFELHDLEDVEKLKIGVVQDFGAHKYLLDKGFYNFDYSSSTKVMAQKLLENKIDTFAAVPYAVHSLGIDTSKLVQTQLKLYSTNLCIAFNKAVEDQEVQKWQRELKKIRQSGEYQKIYQKYLSKEKL